ncbi:MAG: SAM-dependent methyltransferase, partial [Sulfuricurvum sp.]
MSGKLYLIGCGPGDADLLTLKALKTFQKLDVALIDHLLSQEIIDLIPVHT